MRAKGRDGELLVAVSYESELFHINIDTSSRGNDVDGLLTGVTLQGVRVAEETEGTDGR